MEKRRRGRPRIYDDATQQPALVALRIPRILETRLRQDATVQQSTLTDFLLQALQFWWEHGSDGKELAMVRAALTRLETQYTALEQRHQKAQTDLDRVRDQRNKMRGERDKARNDCIRAEEALARYRVRYYQLERELEPGKNPPSELSPYTRKALFKLCHPDKWSQGQPATELSHELMVYLTQQTP